MRDVMAGDKHGSSHRRRERAVKAVAAQTTWMRPRIVDAERARRWARRDGWKRGKKVEEQPRLGGGVEARMGCLVMLGVGDIFVVGLIGF